MERAVPWPLAAGISAFLHLDVFASILPLSIDILGLLNAAPAGVVGSIKSSNILRKPGAIDLGSIDKIGINIFCRSPGLSGCISVILLNLSSDNPIQKSRFKGLAISSLKY